MVSAALAAGLLCGTPALASAAYAPPPTSASTRASSSSASTRLDTNLATPPLPDDAGESVILDYGKVRVSYRRGWGAFCDAESAWALPEPVSDRQ